MNEYPTTNQTEGHFVEIKLSVEEFPGIDLWVEPSLSVKIKGKFGLQEEQISQVRGESCIDTHQDCHDVVLEGTNSLLSPVRVVHVRQD
jgi:hypothetical protein